MPARIIEAETPETLAIVRRLFEEYAAVARGRPRLPGLRRGAGRPARATTPARPGGLLLGFDGDEPAGCVAFRPLEPGIAEMKRLYVRPAARGGGLGSAAGRARRERRARRGIPAHAARHAAGDAPAQGLYLALGFAEIPPYRHNPVPGARFLELDLRPGVEPFVAPRLPRTTMTPESLAFLKSLLDTPGPLLLRDRARPRLAAGGRVVRRRGPRRRGRQLLRDPQSRAAGRG